MEERWKEPRLKELDIPKERYAEPRECDGIYAILLVMYFYFHGGKDQLPKQLFSVILEQTVGRWEAVPVPENQSESLKDGRGCSTVEKTLTPECGSYNQDSRCYGRFQLVDGASYGSISWTGATVETFM